MSEARLDDLLRDYQHDAGLRQWFVEEPHAVLHHYGLDGESTVQHVQTVIAQTTETQFADFSRDYDTDAGGDIFDSSLNQQVDTDGGHFSQDIVDNSVHASGAGSVAAGGDISGSNVVTGNGNTIGSGNVSGNGNVVGHNNQAVTGDHNVSGFGSGAVTSTNTGAVTIGEGGSFNSGGTTTIDNSSESLHNVGNTVVDNSVSHSGNTTIDESVEHSYNDSSDNSDHGDYSINHSGNDTSDNSWHESVSTQHSFNDC